MLLTEKLPGAGGGGGGGGGLLGGDSTLRDHAAVQSESTQFHRRVDFALRGQTSLQSVRFSTLLSFLRTFPPWVMPCGVIHTLYAFRACSVPQFCRVAVAKCAGPVYY